jgi:hypothetical protein
MPAAKPIALRPNHTDGGRITKTVTLSRAACAIVWRASKGTGLTHSAVIEFLVRKYGEELIAHDKKILEEHRNSVAVNGKAKDQKRARSKS